MDFAIKLLVLFFVVAVAVMVGNKVQIEADNKDWPFLNKYRGLTG